MRQTGQAAVAVAVLLVTAALAFLAMNDPASPSLPLACPFRSLTGLLCPGCGSLSAIHDLLNLRMADAFRHNPMSVSLVLLAPFAFLLRRRLRRSPLWGWGFALAFATFWVVRNL